MKDWKGRLTRFPLTSAGHCPFPPLTPPFRPSPPITSIYLFLSHFLPPSPFPSRPLSSFPPFLRLSLLHSFSPSFPPFVCPSILYSLSHLVTLSPLLSQLLCFAYLLIPFPCLLPSSLRPCLVISLPLSLSISISPPHCVSSSFLPSFFPSVLFLPYLLMCSLTHPFPFVTTCSLCSFLPSFVSYPLSSTFPPFLPHSTRSKLGPFVPFFLPSFVSPPFPPILPHFLVQDLFVPSFLP